MNFDPSLEIFSIENFGEFGGVNPSIADSSTFTFMKADVMLDTFHGESKGCFLYSRHWNPTNKYLSDALAEHTLFSYSSGTYGRNTRGLGYLFGHGGYHQCCVSALQRRRSHCLLPDYLWRHFCFYEKLFTQIQYQCYFCGYYQSRRCS